MVPFFVCHVDGYQSKATSFISSRQTESWLLFALSFFSPSAVFFYFISIFYLYPFFLIFMFYWPFFNGDSDPPIALEKDARDGPCSLTSRWWNKAWWPVISGCKRCGITSLLGPCKFMGNFLLRVFFWDSAILIFSLKISRMTILSNLKVFIKNEANTNKTQGNDVTDIWAFRYFNYCLSRGKNELHIFSHLILIRLPPKIFADLS